MRELRAADGGMLGWFFGSWAGRGMLVLMGLVCLLAFFVVREDGMTRAAEKEEAVSRRLDVLMDETERSSSSLVTQLACAEVNGEAGLQEVGRARRALEGMEHQTLFRIGREVGAMKSLLVRVEALYGRVGGEPSPAALEEAGELADGLRYQLQELREALRDKQLEWQSMRSWKLQRGKARRTQVVAAVLMLAFLAFLWPAWMCWHGREKLARHMRDLERGVFGGVVAVEKSDDTRDLLESANRISEVLAAMEKEKAESSAAEHKTARQLSQVLDGMARGNFERRFDPGKQSAWVPVAAALQELLASLKSEWDEREALEARDRSSVQVSRDDLFLLERLLRAEGGEVAATLARLPGNSPVREFAENLALIGGGCREALNKIDESLREIRESWQAVGGAVSRREEDLEKEYEFIHETSSTVDEVSVAAKQSSQMVEHVFRASQKAMSTAEEGRELVRQSIEGMNTISEQVSTIAHHILGLSKKAQEVGNIVRAVGEVSKQTNLLALNAAIEAAGAGEHGKGFAVVAKEIRELAVKSSESTQAIEKLIRDMQDATNTAVLATEEGSKSVQVGVRTINSVNASFGQILERSEEVVESAQQISTASQEQTTGARQVAASIGSIDKMMLTSLRDLREMKKRFHDFQRLVEGLEGMSGDLAEGQRNTQ